MLRLIIEHLFANLRRSPRAQLGRATLDAANGQMTDHQYDEAKFAELLLYVAARLQDQPAAGAVKVNKVLFFAEFAHMRAFGRPITGAEYQKLQLGPAPRRLLPVRSALIARGDAELRDSVYLGYKEQRLVPLRPARVELFTQDELDIVDQVVASVATNTGADVTEMSHEDMGWRMVDEGQTIPFESAFLRRPVLTDRIRRHAEELASHRQPE